jgi:hypothetical protein
LWFAAKNWGFSAKPNCGVADVARLALCGLIQRADSAA